MSIFVSTLFDAIIAKLSHIDIIPKPVIDTTNQLRDDGYDALLRHTRVEPFAIVDNTVVGQHYTEALYRVSLNVLIAYYLQAVSLLNVGKGIPPIKLLRRLSPEGGVMTLENYVAMLEDIKPHIDSGLSMLTIEASTPGNTSNQATGQPNNPQYRNAPRGGNRGRGASNQQRNNYSTINGQTNQSSTQSSTQQTQATPTVTQPPASNTPTKNKYDETSGSSLKMSEMTVKKSNILIGNQLTIEFDTGERKTPINVNVRYDIIETPPDLLVHYLSSGSPDYSFSTRFRQLRAGKISFWEDFIATTDLLDDQRKLMLMDKANLLKNIIERRGAAIINAASGGGRNYGISSNCLIISTNTMRAVEAKMRGTIDNERVITSIFNVLSLLVLVVVDKEYERFTFYFRNKQTPTTVSAKVLKSGATEKEDSLEALAKALASNRPVNF